LLSMRGKTRYGRGRQDPNQKSSQAKKRRPTVVPDSQIIKGGTDDGKMKKISQKARKALKKLPTKPFRTAGRDVKKSKGRSIGKSGSTVGSRDGEGEGTRNITRKGSLRDQS